MIWWVCNEYDAELHKHIIDGMLQNNRNDIKGALCNLINAGSCIQAELFVVVELLIVAAYEEWIVNAEIAVIVRSKQVGLA